MKNFFTSSAFLASIVAAQRPMNTSICDYYTTALLMNNTAANQETLLTLVVNTAVIGNYTKPNVGVAVAGILAPGMYNGQAVNLAPYFTGALLSTNQGGSMGVSVNFLDGGGAAPLMMNMPANDTTSNQYMLLTHLYEYFAVLLGCSLYGNTTGQYAGDSNLYQVHKFMDLDVAEVGWFIEQVGLSAASFGVASADVTAVGQALNMTFGYRCSPNVSIPATAPAAPQAICIASDCPLAANATCANYASAFPPGNATSASNSTSAPSSTGSSTPAKTSGATTTSGASTPAGSAGPSSTGPTTSAATKNMTPMKAFLESLFTVGVCALFTAAILILG